MYLAENDTIEEFYSTERTMNWWRGDRRVCSIHGEQFTLSGLCPECYPKEEEANRYMYYYFGPE